jgi:GTP cyclohydrolase II
MSDLGLPSRKGARRDVEEYSPVASATVPIADGVPVRLMVWRGPGDDDVIVLEHRDVAADTASTVVRIHSACMTGDVFGSLRCDCGEQLRLALSAITEAPWGVLVYVPAHEGRGIGLANKLRAYVFQDEGLDTFEANEVLGLAPDGREYHGAVAVLAALEVRAVRLLTRNPMKVAAVRSAGFDVAAVEPIDVRPSGFATDYLARKLDWFSTVSDRPDEAARADSADGMAVTIRDDRSISLDRGQW